PPIAALAEEMRDLLAYLSRLTPEGSGGAAPRTEEGVGVTLADVIRPKPGEWPTYHGNLSGNRHSPLDQINKDNVAQLAPRWIFSIANSRRLEVTPLVVNDMVLAGTSGGDEGARGFVDAFRVSTGERAWRFWLMPAPGEPLAETWRGRAIEHGCTAGWLTGTYDPEANLIYWPTGNPCPDYNGDERKGDNLYSS